MKYLLDVVLIVGLLWMGWLWNGEKQSGLKLGDKIDQLKAKVAQLELDLKAATDLGDKVAADLEITSGKLERSTAALQDKADALASKTQEFEALKEAGARLKARVDELEGYKAKAKTAEMLTPLAP
ncbi:MAG: hypothetical protein RBS84_02025 [Kiritimatiellia bacterium]|jgi:chromosome segregation ATPase|nr:hypothetical protein [Kiritimatiellia bacterium]